jgi:hypothetical protein
MTEVERTDWILFLQDLAERLMHVPAVYGTDQSDVDDLQALARGLKNETKLPK